MTPNIDYINIFLGSLMILLPIGIIIKYKLELLKSLFISIFRCVFQLFLIGIFLNYIIEINSIYLNLTWLLVMIIASAFTIQGRSQIKKKYLLSALFYGTIISFIFTSLFFNYLYFSENTYLNAAYLIPISGMLIGNSLSTTIVSLRAFSNDIIQKKDMYKYFIVNSKLPFNNMWLLSLKFALKEGMNPMFANIATIGLIWLPGTMTGQIISGTSPVLAIKYQIIIVIGYFTCCFLTTFFTLIFMKNKIFNKYLILNEIKISQ